MAINKQPVFTTAPILKTTILNPTVVTNVYDPASYLTNSDIIFQSTDASGSLVERITISSTGDLTNTTVTAKLVYIYLLDVNAATYSLYKTAAIPATTVSDTTPNPEIEWVFTGGILVPVDFKFLIGASTNSTNTGQLGDYLSITVEGSTYTAI